MYISFRSTQMLCFILVGHLVIAAFEMAKNKNKSP